MMSNYLVDARFLAIIWCHQHVRDLSKCGPASETAGLFRLSCTRFSGDLVWNV